MRIVYVANHNNGENDDEGAIHHALESLGHNVQRVREHLGSSAHKVPDPDLLLFHKWADLAALERFKGVCPRVFWYFDLVESPGGDPTLRARDHARVGWMRAILPHVELGFCTDGDWVEKVNARQPRVNVLDAGQGKLVWLPQGADERVVGRGDPHCPTCRHKGGQYIDILFTGIREGGGRERVSWVDEVRQRWGDRFVHVRKGVYREELRDMVAASKIVLAPDYPVTDRYWSNRAWNVLGFGGFLLHPACDGLWDAIADHPTAWIPAWIPYHNRNEMHQLIGEYLDLPASREIVSEAGLEEVLAKHLYRHRCEELLKTVKEKA